MDNGEIDLWELSEKCFRFLKHHLRIIVIFFLAALLFSISKIIFQPYKYQPYYTQNFTCESPIASNEVLADIINSIPAHNIGTENTYPVFKTLKAITSTNKNKEVRLIIKTDVFNPKDTNAVLTLIETVINSNFTLKEKYTQFRKQNTELLIELNKQLLQADTLPKPSTNYIHLFEKKQSVEKMISNNKIIVFTK
ncbi:MAG TPA: hypothetical protein VFL70_02530, partial [Bacteroidia bacterium]|nr:hypothetical protein [Bacteroidia bacterium]